MRKCNECEFQVESKQSGTQGVAEELAAMSDHLTQHNPSPAMWAMAYSRMQDAKRNRKSGSPE